jgi:alpha-glucosidase (family GH31 glycosyl hydrolase)
VVVIEAWSDEETFAAFNDAIYEPHADGAPHALADFEFGGRWPDPKVLVDELHEQGCKVLLWQIPLAGSSEGQAAMDARTIVERGYCVRNADGTPYRNPGGWFHDALLIDFTNEEAVDWWLAKRRYLVDELGIDGFKTDGGEHAWGADLLYADGTHGGESNNRYPVRYAQAFHRLTPVTFSRAGFTGAGAVPCHWAGDSDSTWEAFRASITAGLTAGASGVFFWGWDIAGFSGELPSVELYLRAAAMATFCPIMQLHSEFNYHRQPSRDRTPWNVAEQSGDPRALTVFRAYAQLRERLVPYLVEQGGRSTRDCKPLMRAPFFDHPQDENIWRFPYQYMLGDALLVAPVCKPGVDRWQVYLPRGDWLDPWSGSRYGGGETVEVDAPLERIPVFCSASRTDLLPFFQPVALSEVS